MSAERQYGGPDGAASSSATRYEKYTARGEEKDTALGDRQKVSKTGIVRQISCADRMRQEE